MDSKLTPSPGIGPGPGTWGQERLGDSLGPWALFLLIVQKGLFVRVFIQFPGISDPSRPPILGLVLGSGEGEET